MSVYEDHLERMADPAYAAHVKAVVDKAPPLTDEQRHTLGGIFRGSVPSRSTAAPRRQVGAA